MTNLSKVLILNAVLIVILAGGFVFINNVQAESSEPQLITFVDADFNAFPDMEIMKIEVAQNTCGSETCSDSQCCCLNTDTGAQCCRNDIDNNCVSSCQKSDPC